MMKKRHESRTIPQKARTLRRAYGGLVALRPLVKATRASLPLLSVPGVHALASHLAGHPDEVNEYTLRGRAVALVSDGSALLGLGDAGPAAALAALESKALLVKELADVDAIPLALSPQSGGDLADTLAALAPTFSAFVLDGLDMEKAADLEERLSPRTSVPVMLNTAPALAAAVLAGLINAHRVVRKDLSAARIAIVGAGAVGSAVANLLLAEGVGDVVLVDRAGILGPWRTNLASALARLTHRTNREERHGGIREALAGADAVISAAGPRALLPDAIRVMAQRPIVFLLAAPEPDLLPAEAYAAGAAIVATGLPSEANRMSDLLVLPGLLSGLMTGRVRRMSDELYLRAAHKLASLVRRPRADMILPDVLDSRCTRAMASLVR